MNIKQLTDEMHKQFGTSTTKELEKECGCPPNTLTTLKFSAKSKEENKGEVTPKQVVSIMKKTRDGTANRINKVSINIGDIVRPLVEYFPTDILNKPENEKIRKGHDSEIINSMKNSKGIYIFFDGQGKAIYVGKTANTFWQEVRLRYGGLARQHAKEAEMRIPDQSGTRRPDSELTFKSTKVPLKDVAKYFSAYHVDKKVINLMESLLIRIFINGMTNSNVPKMNVGAAK